MSATYFQKMNKYIQREKIILCVYNILESKRKSNKAKVKNVNIWGIGIKKYMEILFNILATFL